MKRDQATKLIEAAIAALCARNEAGSVLELVTGLDVFGSYARGAVEPGDVDINVEYDPVRALERFDVYELMGGRAHSAIRRALIGGSRRAEMVFQARKNPEMYQFDLVTIWGPNDTMDVALSRLHAIVDDPGATRAPREHMLPEFEGLDKFLPVYLREHIKRAVEVGAIELQRHLLPDRRVASASTARYLDERWQTGRPPNRVGHAVMAYFEERGIEAEQIHLHGQDVQHGSAVTPYFAGFGCRYIRHVPDWFTRWDGREHLEIPRAPTLTRPLEALRIVAVNSSRFADLGRHFWD